MVKINSLSEEWIEIEKWAQRERREYVGWLIAGDNEEYRGRIKQLDELLELPSRSM